MKYFTITLLALALPYNSYAAESILNLNAFIGSKSLDSKDWGSQSTQITTGQRGLNIRSGNYDSQAAFGLELDYKRKNWPISIVAGNFGSANSKKINDTDLVGLTSEFNLGIRKTWAISDSMHTFVGGGLALINAERERLENNREVRDDDSGTGSWIGVGFYWTFDNNINLGLQTRYSQAEVDLYEQKGIEAGGNYTGMLFGYHFE